MHGPRILWSFSRFVGAARAPPNAGFIGSNKETSLPQSMLLPLAMSIVNGERQPPVELVMAGGGRAVPESSHHGPTAMACRPSIFFLFDVPLPCRFTMARTTVIASAFVRAAAGQLASTTVYNHLARALPPINARRRYQENDDCQPTSLLVGRHRVDESPRAGSLPWLQPWRAGFVPHRQGGDRLCHTPRQSMHLVARTDV